VNAVAGVSGVSGVSHPAGCCAISVKMGYLVDVGQWKWGRCIHSGRLLVCLLCLVFRNRDTPDSPDSGTVTKGVTTIG
jgi:hypothetical protein